MKTKTDTPAHSGITLPSDPNTAMIRIMADYWNPLLSYCLKLTGNADSAEDVAQIVIIKAYRRLGTFKTANGLPPAGWMFTAAKSAFIDYLKETGTFIIIGIEGLEEIRHASHCDEADYPCRENDMKMLLEIAIASLPGTVQDAITLRYIDGLSNKQIANKLGISESTLDKRIKKAVDFLRSRKWLSVA